VESFYNVASAEEEYSRGPNGNPQHFHEKSHGESFLALVQKNFCGGGFYLLDEPAAEILSFDGGRIHSCPYEKTDSFQVMSMFINHRDQVLQKLLQ